MNSNSLEYLRSVPFFADLSPATTEVLSAAATVCRHPRGTVLCEEGRVPDRIPVLLEGSAQLTASGPKERATVIDVVSPVEALAVETALTGAPSLVRATLIAPGEVLWLPANLLSRTMQQDLRAAASVVALLCRQHRGMVRQVKDLKLRTASQRLGCFLLTLVEANGGAPTRLPYDKRLIAGRLGMTPESLSRALAVLRRQGVEVTASEVRVNDLDRLRAYASPDGLDYRTEMNLKLML